MAFKQDEDFLRFLTMGASGTRAVATDLEARGHRVAELERYATKNKLWATKIKRLRLPDLFCLTCGLRVEARAKSKLEIKLSDSDASGREWDAGLRDADLVAFARCTLSGSAVASVGTPQYFAVQALRANVALAKRGPPKSAADGAERDLTWPSIVPKKTGVVQAIEPDRIRVLLDGGRNQTYARRWPAWHLDAGVGDGFTGGERFLAGPVPRPAELTCPGHTWNPVNNLEAADAVDRYAAVKACGLLRVADARPDLRRISTDQAEDARIRLEAAGALAGIEDAAWVEALTRWARDADAPQGMSLEAIFILSELERDDAVAALAGLARDAALSEDLRAAAAWGLGTPGVNRPDVLLEFIGDANDVVALHAVAALPSNQTAEAVDELRGLLKGPGRVAAAAAEILARQGDAGISALIDALAGPTASRDRALVALGRIARDKVVRLAGDQLSVQAREVLELLWQETATNWIRAGGNTEQLSLLDRQVPS